jgi:hypothetical protein
MLDKEKKIVIDLNSPKVSLIDRKDFVYIEELNKVMDLIKDRVEDINKSPNNYNMKEAFENFRMHDAILIDGKRGSGKTTFLLNVKDEVKNDDDVNVKVLDSIDPNQLDEKSNILLILLAHIYTELLVKIETNIDKNYEKRDKYKRLTTMLHNLTSAISATQERNYEDDYHKLYNLHQSLIIDEKLHDFFSQVCNFFEVDALILPIDDIDMDFIHGYKVIDSIRKYLSTPKIIPIISIDTTQIYALIKKVHYRYFGYSPHASKKDIKSEHELGFLKSLPEEYIQKILMPTRKIVLPDMYELYKFHLKNKKKKIYFSFDSNKLDNNRLKFKIIMDELLKSYINIVLGNYEKNIEDIDNFHILNYLKDKSFRSLFEDMIAFLSGFSNKEDNNLLVYDTKNIKTRLIPLYMTHFDTKYDATIWFWDKYLIYLKDKIDNYISEHVNNSRYESRFYVDISKYILFIDSFHDNNIQRHEQVYVRLYMQDFFIEHIKVHVLYGKEDNKITEFHKIKKEINISGIIELLSRTMLPVYIFETLINEEIIDIFKYNLDELRFFGRDNSDTLRDTMFNLSTSILRYYNDKTFIVENTTQSIEYKQKSHPKYFKYNLNPKPHSNNNNNYNESNKKIIGIFLDTKHRDIFGEYSLFIEKYIDFKRDEEIYFLSPLKFYSIIPHYFKSIYKEKYEEIKTSVEAFTKEYTSNTDIVYGVAYPLLKKEDIIFIIEDSNLGVLSIDRFSKDLVQNILQVSIQQYSNEFIKKISESHTSIYRLFLNKNINAYKTIYFNHLILFLVKKIDNENFNKMKLELGYITKGTKEEDFDKYKTKETYFADNIKKILIYTKKDVRYEKINIFLYKIYLSLVKNHTYQSSYYFIEDDKKFILKYINRYKKEVKEKDYPNQFQELNKLSENLDNLCKEGEFLRNNKNIETHIKILNIYKKKCNENENSQEVMYEIAKEITERVIN